MTWKGGTITIVAFACVLAGGEARGQAGRFQIEGPRPGEPFGRIFSARLFLWALPEPESTSRRDEAGSTQFAAALSATSQSSAAGGTPYVLSPMLGATLKDGPGKTTADAFAGLAYGPSPPLSGGGFEAKYRYRSAHVDNATNEASSYLSLKVAYNRIAGHNLVAAAQVAHTRGAASNTIEVGGAVDWTPGPAPLTVVVNGGWRKVDVDEAQLADGEEGDIEGHFVGWGIAYSIGSGGLTLAADLTPALGIEEDTAYSLTATHVHTLLHRDGKVRLGMIWTKGEESSTSIYASYSVQF